MPRCAPGKFTSGPGAAICLKCVPGKFGNQIPEPTFTIDEACKPCAAGFFRPESSGRHPADYLTNCTICPIGWNSGPGMQSCRKCDVRRYSPNPGNCIDCPENNYADKPGSLNCTSCQMGENFFSRASACTLCDVGRFAVSPGVCGVCPKGWYTEDRGSRECKVCEVGEKYVSPSLPCSSCERGRYGTTQKNACRACPQGFYQDTKRKSSCLLCENGNVKNNGAICEKCDVGMHGVPTKPCVKCEPGLHARGRGQAQCKPCARGLIPNNQSTDCKKPEWTVEEDCEDGKHYLDDLSMRHMPDYVCELDSVCKAHRVKNWKCKLCPTEAVMCAHGVPRRSTMRTLDGWWTVPAELLVKDASSIPSPDGSLPTAEYHQCAYISDCVNGTCVLNSQGPFMLKL